MRPSPALQCTAIAPSYDSTKSKNLSTMAGSGAVPSVKIRSWCLIPYFVNPVASYVLLLSLITIFTPIFLKIGTKSAGVRTLFYEMNWKLLHIYQYLYHKVSWMPQTYWEESNSNHRFILFHNARIHLSWIFWNWTTQAS